MLHGTALFGRERREFGQLARARIAEEADGKGAGLVPAAAQRRGREGQDFRHWTFYLARRQS